MPGVVITNLFPEIYPSEWEPDVEDFQLRTRAKNGFTQINTYDAVNQWRAAGKWNVLLSAQRDQIEDHWFANKRLTFSLWNFWVQKIRDAMVGLGDGTSILFQLPCKQSFMRSVKINGVVASPQPTFLTDNSNVLADQAQFSTAPANGAVITIDVASAQQLYSVNYVTVKFPPRHREADAWTCEIEFEQAVG